MASAVKKVSNQSTNFLALILPRAKFDLLVSFKIMIKIEKKIEIFLDLFPVYMLLNI